MFKTILRTTSKVLKSDLLKASAKSYAYCKLVDKGFDPSQITLFKDVYKSGMNYVANKLVISYFGKTLRG